MQVVHPHALAGSNAPGAVAVAGDTVAIDDDGTFEIPDDATGWLETFAERHGHDPADLVREEDGPPDDETCTVVKNDGEVCGRDLPCPYHTDTDDDTADTED